MKLITCRYNGAEHTAVVTHGDTQAVMTEDLGYHFRDMNDLIRQKKNRKGSVTFTVIGNSNSIVWRLYFYFQGEKYRCTGRNFFNWFPAIL